MNYGRPTIEEIVVNLAKKYMGAVMSVPAIWFAKTRENKSSTDWDGFINGLRAIKYGGVLNFETAPVLTSFPDEMKEGALAFIAQIGKYFAGKIAE